MSQDKYNISLDNEYGYLTVIDVPAIAQSNTKEWLNQTLTQVDGNVMRLGIIKGEFHWHQHDDEDEFFFVLDGQLHIDVEDSDPVVLDAHQGFTIPRGTRHRTRAPHKTTILMSSAATVEPTGT